MLNTIFNENFNRCYGCRACEQICPKHCIKMTADTEGFIFPFIDSYECINCGLCKSVCPVSINTECYPFNLQEQKVYAAWNKDITERMSSSSGGVFSAIAYDFIDLGGIVYGCAWYEDKLTAKQIRLSNKNDIYKLKGSKYVQSSTENTFNEVKIDLKNGLLVLYAGTSCQIAGLKLFLKNDYTNLITIDLICHGTPSPKMLDSYIRYIENIEGSRISNLKFRDKKISGWRSWVTWDNKKNQKKRFVLGGSTPYMFGFYRGFFSRESCYNCQFTTPKRVGDITLGDYWGIDKYHPELYSQQKHGISLVICNTNKGMSYINNIGDSVQFEESKLKYAIAGNHSLSKQNIRNPYRNIVYYDLENKGFEYMANHYLKPKFMLIRSLIPSELKNIYKDLKWKLIKK